MLVRGGHQLALGLAQGLAPLGVVGAGGDGAAIEADGVADAPHPAQQIAVVDEGLVAALAVVVEGALEQLGGAVGSYFGMRIFYKVPPLRSFLLFVVSTIVTVAVFGGIVAYMAMQRSRIH